MYYTTYKTVFFVVIIYKMDFIGLASIKENFTR